MPWGLKRPGFLERLSDAEKKRLMQICPPRVAAKGVHIVRRGDPADALFIVLKGTVKLKRATSKGTQVVALAGPGDLFGDRFLSEGAVFESDAVAAGDSVVCPIDREQLEQVARELPRVALVIAGVLAERLAELEARLEWALLPAAQKLARAFLDLAQRFGEAESEWVRLEPPLTHEEIAGYAGLTRVTVTQLISFFKERGILEGGRGHYRLLPAALEALCTP